MKFEDWPIDDLRLIISEGFVDDDGDNCHAVYSIRLDAITFIDNVDLNLLLKRGIKKMKEIPE